jgi:uncharacterized integral membrane protein
MFILIATLIFGGAIAFFAIQNASPVDLQLSSIHFTAPLYWVVLGSVLLTLIFSWLLSLINSISSSFVLHGKNNAVKQLKNENAELLKKIHQLEMDKAREQGNKKVKTSEDQ